MFLKIILDFQPPLQLNRWSNKLCYYNLFLNGQTNFDFYEPGGFGSGQDPRGGALLPTAEIVLPPRRAPAGNYRVRTGKAHNGITRLVLAIRTVEAKCMQT